MAEISAKTQMAKIRNFERGFMATHLINIGNKVGVFAKLNVLSEPASPQYTLTNLTDNTSYHFAVTWYDSEGFESNYSSFAPLNGCETANCKV
jgi:hypothetical protein